MIRYQYLLTVSACCLLASCRAEDRAPAGDSVRADQRAPVAAAESSANTDVPPGPPPSDHAVYAAVLREAFMKPEGGEHSGEHDNSLGCSREEPGNKLAIVGTTQSLPPGNAARDSGWANEFPPRARPLMVALRAMDNEPARALVADSFAVGVPIRLVPDTAADRMIRLTPPPRADGTEAGAPALFWFSRVAYTADNNWALVYAVEMCPGVTDAVAAEAENGTYERTLLAPLEWRGGSWKVHPLIYLDVGLPRLQRRQASPRQ